MKVAVVDTNGKTLAPTTPRMAKILLRRGKAAVLRRFPFTLILKKEVANPSLPDLRLKIDPGSKTTGLAIVSQESGEVVFAAELYHRGQAIKSSLDSRRSSRCSRRNRKTRYRKPRFNNRARPKGWIAPSLKSRVDNVATWTHRLTRFYPIYGIAMELVRFDTQLLENAEIKGLEYQQGELAGYELKEYLLLKWGHRMALGARLCNVLRLVVGQGLIPTLLGTALGVAGALALTRLMAGLLFGVSATDPLTFVVIALLLTLVALLA